MWLSDRDHGAHAVPGHPERPERIMALEAALERQGHFGWSRAQAPAASLEQLEAVHTAEHVRFVERLSAAGGGAVDGDTFATSGTFGAAARAAGGAATAVDAVFAGARAAFSATRPPGHHAEEARAMGFCFFNSVAVAARHAIAAHGIERVLILDWDVHHGNGTNDIFHADPDVLFISIHESPLYPGTGPAADVGSRAGQGRTVNLPVPPGTGDAAYVSLVEHVVAPLALAHGSQLVLVSAGFDAHIADPLARGRVTEAGYAAMAARMRRIGAELEAPLALVLEGGYAVDALASSVAAVLPVLGARDLPPVSESPVHPLAREALVRLEPYWAGISAA
jgi:acetoin utilization deacetylase AcuC-like enzyme